MVDIDEVDVIGKPAERKDDKKDSQHFHNLKGKDIHSIIGLMRNLHFYYSPSSLSYKAVHCCTI